MTQAVPVCDTKDTARFAQTVNEAGESILVTKNGYGEYVALSVEERDSLRHRAAMADLYEQLLVSEWQAAEGQAHPYEELRGELRARDMEF